MTSETKITSDDFGVTSEGQKVTRYTLSNSHGLVVKIIDFGGVITEINVPDKNGKLNDINLGFDTFQEYEVNRPHFGALIGRVANRIAGAQFILDGQTYDLFVNNGPNCLHGGKVGFDRRQWQSSVKDNKLVLKYVSLDGEENFPGELNVTVVYTLDDNNALTIDYSATTTKTTPINLTNHSYFNLAGHDAGHINDHVITIPAESYLPLDQYSIPTGEIKAVSGNEYDLRTPVSLGDRLNKVPGGIGFDNNFCLNNNGQLKLAARVEHPPSGRYMEISTTVPGIQFYTAYYLTNVTGKGGVAYERFGAFCLEAQHYPDSVHQPSFPNSYLHPGETYTQKTVHKFGVL
uniref:Aldose 1-epimerase n=2 Tax=Arion vulgaris TaxID=1028688 RepID=A0A0B7ADB9_9EUPU